jgi:predicted dinucleotide-utilizing enzyme
VYATNVGWNVVERHAFTPTTEVFLNTNKVQIGFDAAGANIFKGGVTMAVMHVGAFSDRKIKHHIWQVARRMGLAVV